MHNNNAWADDSAVIAADTWPSSSVPSGSIATFSGIAPDGALLVELSPDSVPLCAVSTVALAAEEIGSRVVVIFDQGDPSRPIIIGRIQERTGIAVAPAANERRVIEASRQIELRCGEASIVLTSAGKVLIRGAHVVSRSRGANKIKGAIVDIN